MPVVSGAASSSRHRADLTAADPWLAHLDRDRIGIEAALRERHPRTRDAGRRVGDARARGEDTQPAVPEIEQVRGRLPAAVTLSEAIAGCGSPGGDAVDQDDRQRRVRQPLALARPEAAGRDR